MRHRARPPVPAAEREAARQRLVDAYRASFTESDRQTVAKGLDEDVADPVGRSLRRWELAVDRSRQLGRVARWPVRALAASSALDFFDRQPYPSGWRGLAWRAGWRTRTVRGAVELARARRDTTTQAHSWLHDRARIACRTADAAAFSDAEPTATDGVFLALGELFTDQLPRRAPRPARWAWAGLRDDVERVADQCGRALVDAYGNPPRVHGEDAAALLDWQQDVGRAIGAILFAEATADAPGPLDPAIAIRELSASMHHLVDDPNAKDWRRWRAFLDPVVNVPIERARTPPPALDGLVASHPQLAEDRAPSDGELRAPERHPPDQGTALEVEELEALGDEHGAARGLCGPADRCPGPGDTPDLGVEEAAGDDLTFGPG